MNPTPALLPFLRDVEAALPGWMGRVLTAARSRLEGGGLGLGAVEKRDLIAAQAVLDNPAPLLQAWSRELVAGWHASSASEAVAAPATQPAMLTLKDEHEVDQEIELSRLIQDLEARAEHILRDLRALCSALRGSVAIQLDAPPLHPHAVAQALGRAVSGLPLAPGGRMAVLKAVSAVCGETWVPVLQSQLRQLRAAGVQPADYRVQVAPRPAAAAAAAQTEEAPQGRIQAVLRQMMARTGAEPAGPISDAWMDGVVQAVLQEAAPAPRMRQVFERLAEPGRQLARSDPALWQQPDHVWWQLLDRLLALCAVLEARPGGAQDRVAERCEAAITRLCTDLPPDSAMCRAVLEQVTAAGRLAAEQEAPGDPTAPPPGDLTGLVRQQMAQQLRGSAAPGSMRRFLMGPWLRVLVAALDPARGDPAAARRFTDWVDRLLAAVHRPPKGSALAALLATAREGLATIELPEAQRDTWLFDLATRLDEASAQDDNAPQHWKHEDLPTVPIDLHSAGVHNARARRDRVAWINGLRVGDICRLFLDTDTGWCTAQLIVDPVADAKGDDVYVFQTRQPRRQHPVTRAALERLRSEGLATTIEGGTFIARALDTVAARLDEVMPPRGTS